MTSFASLMLKQTKPLGRFLGSIFVIVLTIALAPMVNAKAETDPEERSIQLIVKNAETQMFSDPALALKLSRHVIRRAKNIAHQQRRLELTATGHWLTGEALLRLGQPQNARKNAEIGLTIVSNYPEMRILRGKLLQSMGSIEVELSHPDRALIRFHQAHDVFRDSEDPRSQAIALQSIGWLYRNAQDLVRAERYYRQSVEIYIADPALEISARNNLANVLRQMERFSDADLEYRRGLLLAKRQNNQSAASTIYRNMARNKIESGKIEEAESLLNDAIAVSGYRDRYAVALLAQTAAIKDRLSVAEKLIGEAFIGIDTKTSNQSFVDAHEIAHDIYSRTGKTALALKHLEAAKRLTEESMSVAASTSSALMAARFDYQNQELRISQLKATELKRSIEFERARARLQRWIFAITGFGVAIIIGILGFAVVTLRRSRNEVRAANQGLERSNIALEKALAAKTEFLATTSHEIRTPLNGILGMTQVMLADARLSAQMRDRIGVVHGAGVTMRALVDDILDVAKMETGNLTVEQVPVDVADVLLDVSRMWREQAAAKGLGFDLEVADDLGWIESDPARLRQIVFNLLSNAIKFTDNGAVALIARRAAAAGEAKPHLEILVRDTGIGIPAEKQHLIFESFRQADAGTTRRFGGTGLGLAICRNLADALGGTIAVESGEGRGSTFRVLLPMVPVEQPGQIGTSTAVMLVLERNPIARSTLKTLLEPHAGEVMFATSVEDACARIVDHRIRLVLADQATLAAEADFALALETLAACARDNCAKSAILWSAPSEEDERRAQAAGVDIFLAKPIAARALVSALFGDSQPAGGVTPLVPQAA